MTAPKSSKNHDFSSGFARLAVAAVFVVNVACALEFIIRPDLYVGGFELSGEVGRVVVRSIGILFLMWNATYPPVIWQPQRQRVLFLVVLAQQLIGVLGESWLYLILEPGHAALRAVGLRFIWFDAAGLVLMGLAFVMLTVRHKLDRPPRMSHE